MQLSQQLLQDDWVVTANMGDSCDFTTPDEMGRIDALLGMPCNPLAYFCELGDVELYVLSWKETMGQLPAVVNGVDVAAELEEYREDMEDRSFWAGGTW